MRFFFALLFALTMTANAYAAAAETRYCCSSDDCTAAQCIEMGCLPAASPVVPQSARVIPSLEAPDHVTRETAMYLPNRSKEVWTPPD
jgi:hypothetical protein